jgi:deoxyribodipyrimidine photolyase-related protein
MSDATIIYPHQLFQEHPGLANGRPVFIIEDPLLLTHNPAHRQRLILHRLSIDAYAADLTARGFAVIIIGIHDIKSSQGALTSVIEQGFTSFHIADTTDNYLEQAIANATREDATRVWYESPLFLLGKEEAMERYTKSKRFMASFYQALRKDKKLLLTDDDKPIGGKWSFDSDNRKRVPKGAALPTDLTFADDPKVAAAETWAANLSTECYGEGGSWIPYTHEAATAWLDEFIKHRLKYFGPYEDAITTEHTRLWHSALSPMMNIGLITPKEVLDATLAYTEKHDVPLASLEGFVRQVLGWREFIRAAYEVDGRAMRTKNFFNHNRLLPASFWISTTDIAPFDVSVKRTLSFGYTHHIERLMVLGNFMLLNRIHPDEVYRWFMGMYVDAYDWVMVPNVYGMSQFADGGLFATKPYLSGSSYIKKMSDFSSGDWEEVWTALYWEFETTSPLHDGTPLRKDGG